MNCRSLVIAVIVSVFVIVGIMVNREDHPLTSDVEIAVNSTYTTLLGFREPYLLELADSPEKRQQGLSGRENIANHSGMLFIFDTNDYHGIWMPDMNFSIDIIWLDEAKQVVAIESRVAPETYPRVFKPTVPAKYVIELPAGTAATEQLVVGQVLEFLTE
jgi:uncharacterized protein